MASTYSPNSGIASHKVEDVDLNSLELNGEDDSAKDYSVEDISIWDVPDIGAGALSAKSGVLRKSGLVEDIHTSSSKVKDAISFSEYKELIEKSEKNGFERGFRRGLKEGSKKGFKEGLLRSKDKVQETVSSLSNMINKMKYPLEKQDQEISEVVVNLAIRMAEAVVDRELSVNRSSLLHFVKQGMSNVPVGEGDIVIDVHPDDFRLLEKEAEKNSWVLNKNVAVDRGGYILKSGGCEIDSQVDRKMRQVAEQYREAIKVKRKFETGKDDD